jgi:DNA-directed RNA polymerase specialized sigma24 family protein
MLSLHSGATPVRARSRTMTVDDQLLQQALAGDRQALRKLVDGLTPIIHVRVAQVLLRNPQTARRNIEHEVADLTQEVFLALFAENGRALKAWDVTRGLSFPNFVGLLAGRLAITVLRSGRRNPFAQAPTDISDLEASAEPTPGPEPRAFSREILGRLLERLEKAVSPRGFELFCRLFVDQESVESVCDSTGLSADAVYAWRSRLGKLVRSIGSELEMEQAVSESPEMARMTSRGGSR